AINGMILHFYKITLVNWMRVIYNIIGNIEFSDIMPFGSACYVKASCLIHPKRRRDCLAQGGYASLMFAQPQASGPIHHRGGNRAIGDDWRHEHAIDPGEEPPICFQTMKKILDYGRDYGRFSKIWEYTVSHPRHAGTELRAQQGRERPQSLASRRLIGWFDNNDYVKWLSWNKRHGLTITSRPDGNAGTPEPQRR
ncbi:hypothetical protein, partial [Telmatospirillum sp.]|uniref:hypothetical protein n=1 Tax=Telmatospirillum sp. TaxID=2079197 RepID=UPI002851D443